MHHQLHYLVTYAQLQNDGVISTSELESTYESSMHTAKKIGCLTVVTLVADMLKIQKFILVLEANCISNLNPNHTLQLTTLRTSVRESQQDAKAGQMFSMCKVMVVIGCLLIQAGVTPSQMFSGY